jgi:hypothetical protein
MAVESDQILSRDPTTRYSMYLCSTPFDVRQIFIGADVYSGSDEKLGDIKDLIVSENGPLLVLYTDEHESPRAVCVV